MQEELLVDLALPVRLLFDVLRLPFSCLSMALVAIFAASVAVGIEG